MTETLAVRVDLTTARRLISIRMIGGLNRKTGKGGKDELPFFPLSPIFLFNLRGAPKLQLS